jgi:hypothetical protein
MLNVEAVEKVPEREVSAMPIKCDLLERSRNHVKFFGGVNAYPK